MGLDKLKRKHHLKFYCNGCLAIRRAIITEDLREGLVCPICGLNSRQRAILFAVQKKTKKGFFRKRNLRIVGVSDGAPIESTFRDRFGSVYKNFEYHTEPFLDITKIDETLMSTANIVTCSEVLEHVQPPINLAFEGLFKLLKPGGWLILSVPHKDANFPHEEHFPVMTNAQLIFEPNQMLKGVDLEGNEREFLGLVFHGGAGATLEYRVFSETSLLTNLKESGFNNIQAQANNRLIGCVWEPWSRVWVAQKPAR